jgi:hypothetical protein
MSVSEVTRYRTSDGREFADRSHAEAHESAAHLTKTCVRRLTDLLKLAESEKFDAAGAVASWLHENRAEVIRVLNAQVTK